MALPEKMHERELVQRQDRPLHPVVASEDDIAVEPCNLVAGLGNTLDSDVEQSVLLPHDIAAAELNEYVGVLSPELETTVEGELHRDQWNCKMLAKYPVILTPAFVTSRVEIGRQCPECT